MCEGFELRLEFDFEVVNGTLVPVVRPVLVPCPEDPGPVIAGVFLSFIFITAFLLNMVAVVTIATSYTLKRFLYCHILINLCLTCMFDCFFNLSISIGYVTSAPWRFGYGMSYFNGFTINLVNSEMAFAVVLLAADRLMAARKYTRYLSMEKNKMGLIIFATWVAALLLAAPLVCGFVLSVPYRNRYSCSVADPRDDYYLIAHFLLVVVLATTFMVVAVVVTGLTFHRERRKQKKIRGNQTIGYFDQILMTPYFRTEFYPAVFAICVVVAYVVLWLPFTFVTTLGPMVTQHWANNTAQDAADDTFSLFNPANDGQLLLRRAMMDSTQLTALNATVTPNITSDISSTMSNFTMDENLIPEVMQTPMSDTVFVWFHYIFDIVVPILVFIVLRDVRAKSESLIMCCRPNSVDVASPKPMRPPYLKQNSTPGTADGQTASKQKKQKGSSKNTIGFKTPILFATSEGLHIRTVEETYLDMIDNKPLIGFGRQNTDPVFTYDMCDVAIGYEDLTDFDGQYHIDDNYDNDRDSVKADLVSSNPVVMGANRAAMGQKPQVIAEDEYEVPPDVDIRPPTPPKVHIVGNEPALNLGDDVDEDVKRSRKGKKVRFATMLNEEIPNPDSGDESSALESSSGSTRSSDSGIMADTERSSAGQYNGQRKARFTVRKPGERSFPPRNAAARRLPPSKKPDAGAGRGMGTKMRNIKSRHMANMESPITPLEAKPSEAGRRFSRPSGNQPRGIGPSNTK